MRPVTTRMPLLLMGQYICINGNRSKLVGTGVSYLLEDRGIMDLFTKVSDHL
jgi:hypothetical protein